MSETSSRFKLFIVYVLFEGGCGAELGLFAGLLLLLFEFNEDAEIVVVTVPLKNASLARAVCYFLIKNK